MPRAAGLSRTVIVSRVDRSGDTVKQSQRRVTSPTQLIEACLLATRSKIFRQHLKCSLTAPRRAGTSFGFFFCFFLLSQLSEPGRLGTALSRPASRLQVLAPYDLQRLWYLADGGLLFIFNLSNAESRGTWKGWWTFAWMNCQAVVRRHWLFFFFFFFLMLTRRRRGLGERGDKILRWGHSNCTHYDACRRETAWVFPETLRSASRKTLSSRFRLKAYRTVQTRPVSSRSVHHGIFPDVYFYTQSLQRPHERRPMASRREQVSALFFVAWTQRRLSECFPWATEGPNRPKETLTFKKEFFWQTTSGSLPAGLKFHWLNLHACTYSMENWKY